MKLNHVKYTEDSRPYIEFKVRSGMRKGYVTRRFGKILTCPICKKEFFTRDAQLKKGVGKFCSVKCAKALAKEISRKEEILNRYSKKIKDRIVYFRENGKIYTEKRDNKGKVYRYYGEIRKCLVCGEDFFANFSQIKLNRAKFCSYQCARFERKGGPREEITPVTPVEEEVTPAVPAKEEIAPVAPVEEEITPVAPAEEEITPMPEPQPYKLKKEEIVEEEKPIRLREKPIGVLVFGIVIIYIGLYHLIAGLRAYSTTGGQFKTYLLTVANLLLGYAILGMRSWATKLLYLYLISIVGATITAYGFALFVEPSFKTFVFSREFLTALCFTFIPYILALIYLTRPHVKE